LVWIEEKVVKRKLAVVVLAVIVYVRVSYVAVAADGAGPNNRYIIFVDALGQPIGNANVKYFDVNEFGEEVPSGVLLLAADGTPKTPLPGGYRSKPVVLTHPYYGTGEVVRYYYGQQPNEIVYITPLVRRGSPEAARSIRGFVLNDANQPVPGVSMTCSSAEGPGGLHISAIRAVTVITDEHGWFQMYLPLNPRSVAYEMPPGCRYRVAVKPPIQSLLVPDVLDISNDEQATLVLVSDMPARTLIFEDANGPIKEPKKLRGIHMWLKLPGSARNMYFKYGELKQARKLPFGVFEPWMSYNQHDYRFNTMQVTAESPLELHFVLQRRETKESITFTGEVVNGRTGRAVGDVFVIWADSTEQDLSAITGDQWDRIHELGPAPSLEEPALKPVGLIRPFFALARTDENGRFEMIANASRLRDFVIAFEKDYVCIPHYLNRDELSKLRESVTVDVGTLKLYPSATVLIKPLIEEPPVRIWAKWKIETDNSYGWSRNLNDEYRLARQFLVDHHLSPNQVNTMHIPAGVDVQIQLEVLPSLTWDLRQWESLQTEAINASQGQRVDLGRFEFTPKITLYVEALDPNGRAVEGVAVENWTGPHDCRTFLTDAEGIAEFMVARRQKGNFVVRCHDSHLLQTIAYQTSGPADANRVYTLQLSDEMMQALFGKTKE
jgi:hypothetical protein